MSEADDPLKAAADSGTAGPEPIPGKDELRQVVEWMKRNTSFSVSLLALLVSALALLQSHRSADIADGQLRLASRPFLYGTCNFTRSDFLKLSPIPDALLIAQPNSSFPLQIQTLTKPLPIVPAYEKLLPWIVDRCSITNTGKGTAQGIQAEILTMFVNEKTQSPSSEKIRQPFSIEFLPPGATYDFIVANRRDDTALILMPRSVTYQVGLTGEVVTEPLLHNLCWNQLTLTNRLKPQNLKPGE